MIRIVSMEPNHITPSLPKHPSVFPEDRLRSGLRNAFRVSRKGDWPGLDWLGIWSLT